MIEILRLKSKQLSIGRHSLARNRLSKQCLSHRKFILKELHGWSHETALVRYLIHRPELCEQLGFETVPDQSTLWRSWHERFTADLRETVETAARTILIKAQNSGSEFRVNRSGNFSIKTRVPVREIQTIRQS